MLYISHCRLSRSVVYDLNNCSHGENDSLQYYRPTDMSVISQCRMIVSTGVYYFSKVETFKASSEHLEEIP